MGRLQHRNFPGATYFVTTKCWKNEPVFQVLESAEIVIEKMLEYRHKGSYFLHEFVVMPNHLHLLLTPEPSASIEKAIQLIKGGSSYEIHRVRGTKSQTWQPGFHESRVRDAADYRAKRDYINLNPVAAKIVQSPEDWPFGSACGKYALDPIPQRLKPLERVGNVGPKGPTPRTCFGAADQ